MCPRSVRRRDARVGVGYHPAVTRPSRVWALPLLLGLVGCDVSPAPLPTAGSAAPSVASSPVAAPSASLAVNASPPAESARAEVPPAASSSAATAPSGGVLPTGPIASAALAPAASAASRPSVSAAAASGLPASKTGVLQPGEAERVHAKKAAPKVTLVEPGAEPRTVLAYTFREGDRQEVPITLDVSMNMRDPAGNSLPTAVPRMVLRLDLLAKEVRDGNAGMEALVRGLELVPKGPLEARVAEALKGQLDTVKGLRMTYRLAKDGRTSDMVVVLPDGAPAAAQQALASMSQSFESMTAPFPKEAVGKGARWHLTGRVLTGGADILQRVTYTLLGTEGDRVRLGLSVVQLAADPTVKAPGMPDQVKATMKAFRSEGAGEVEARLDLPACDKGSLRILSGMTVAISGAGPIQPAGGGQESTIDTTMTVSYGAVSP